MKRIFAQAQTKASKSIRHKYNREYKILYRMYSDINIKFGMSPSEKDTARGKAACQATRDLIRKYYTVYQQYYYRHLKDLQGGQSVYVDVQ